MRSSDPWIVPISDKNEDVDYLLSNTSSKRAGPLTVKIKYNNDDYFLSNSSRKRAGPLPARIKYINVKYAD